MSDTQDFSNIADELMAAINKKLEDEQDDGLREHLGASIIGKLCEREIWYSFRWAVLKKHSGRMLRLFERGHLEEFRFEKWIEPHCEDFWALDPRTGEQIRVKDLKGYFGGSLDGVARNVLHYRGSFLTEFKTHSEKSFKKLVVQGVRESKPEHFDQMQTYLKYNPKLVGALYFAICKNDDEMYIEFVPREESAGEAAVAKAAHIISSDQPCKAHDGAAEFNFYCRYFCDYSAVCDVIGGRQAPHKTCRSCSSVDITDDGWYCSKHERILTAENQKEGCGDYERLF